MCHVYGSHSDYHEFLVRQLDVRDMHPLEVHKTIQRVYFKSFEDGDEPELQSNIKLVPRSKHIAS